MSIWSEAINIIPAFFSGDSWELGTALKTDGAWLMGTLFTILGGLLVMAIYRAVPFIERHLERSIMVYSYLLIALIIFVEVIRRFVFSVQAPWSTTFPPVLFLVMTWFGCSYNIKLRTHLSFNEFRMNMRRSLQMACLSLDAILWLTFCIIVVVTSSRVAAQSASNFQILEGTDNFLKWWFLITVPIAFIMMSARVMQNWRIDYSNYKSGNPMIKQAVIGGDV
jgi:TRAP-type C4-dicarboxylate transport system permease small subunit